MAKKVWIASKSWNKVSHRELTAFELRNHEMFARFHSAHDTREEAMTALVGYRREAMAQAKKELASAERALAKALQMQEEARKHV